MEMDTDLSPKATSLQKNKSPSNLVRDLDCLHDTLHDTLLNALHEFRKLVFFSVHLMRMVVQKYDFDRGIHSF